MRWYDYAVCFFYADIITAGMLAGNILILGMGLGGYILYESMRKDGEF